MVDDPEEKPDDRVLPERIVREEFFEAPLAHLVLPKYFVGQFPKVNATPPVLNVERWKFVNTAPFLVTDFKKGQEGQRLYILGDGQTTLQHGVNILMVSGTNTLLINGRVYYFIRLLGKWREIAGTGGGGGGPVTGIGGHSFLNVPAGLPGYKCACVEWPFDFVITAARLYADATGSAEFDIEKYANFANFDPTTAGTSICATNRLILSTSFKHQSTLTGWTLAHLAGTLLRYKLISISGAIKQMTIAITYERT